MSPRTPATPRRHTPASPLTASSAPPSPTTSPASPTPAAISIPGFGSVTPLFHDDFRDIISGWYVGANETGSVAYTDGALQFEARRDDGWYTWSGRWTLRARPVLRIEGDFIPPPNGAFGLVCSDDDAHLVVGAVTTDGGWRLMYDDGTGLEEIASDFAAGLRFADGQPVHLALDCAGTATGQAHVRLSLHRVAIVHEEVPGGPASFTYAGVYSEAFDLPHRLRVEEVTAFVGTGED